MWYNGVRRIVQGAYWRISQIEKVEKSDEVTNIIFYNLPWNLPLLASFFFFCDKWAYGNKSSVSWQLNNNCIMYKYITNTIKIFALQFSSWGIQLYYICIWIVSHTKFKETFLIYEAGEQDIEEHWNGSIWILKEVLVFGRTRWIFDIHK